MRAHEWVRDVPRREDRTGDGDRAGDGAGDRGALDLRVGTDDREGRGGAFEPAASEKMPSSTPPIDPRMSRLRRGVFRAGPNPLASPRALPAGLASPTPDSDSDEWNPPEALADAAAGHRRRRPPRPIPPSSPFQDTPAERRGDGERVRRRREARGFGAFALARETGRDEERGRRARASRPEREGRRPNRRIRSVCLSSRGKGPLVVGPREVFSNPGPREVRRVGLRPRRSRRRSARATRRRARPRRRFWKPRLANARRRRWTPRRPRPISAPPRWTRSSRARPSPRRRRRRRRSPRARSVARSGANRPGQFAADFSLSGGVAATVRACQAECGAGAERSRGAECSPSSSSSSADGPASFRPDDLRVSALVALRAVSVAGGVAARCAIACGALDAVAATLREGYRGAAGRERCRLALDAAFALRDATDEDAPEPAETNFSDDEERALPLPLPLPLPPPLRSRGTAGLRGLCARARGAFGTRSRGPGASRRAPRRSPSSTRRRSRRRGWDRAANDARAADPKAAETRSLQAAETQSLQAAETRSLRGTPIRLRGITSRRVAATRRRRPARSRSLPPALLPPSRLPTATARSLCCASSRGAGPPGVAVSPLARRRRQGGARAARRRGSPLPRRALVPLLRLVLDLSRTPRVAPAPPERGGDAEAGSVFAVGRFRDARRRDAVSAQRLRGRRQEPRASRRRGRGAAPRRRRRAGVPPRRRGSRVGRETGGERAARGRERRRGALGEGQRVFVFARRTRGGT